MTSCALRYLVSSAVDGPFGSSLTSAHYSDAGTRVVRLGNIGDGYWRDADEAFIADDYAATLRRHEVLPGDVVIAGLGDRNNPLGRSAVVPALGPAIVKADCFRVRLTPRLDVRYFVHYMTGVGSRIARERAHGSTRQRLPLGEVLDLPVPVPPLEAQRRIADYLDTETARIDALVDRNRDAAALVRERFARFVVTQVFGGRWRPGEAPSAAGVPTAAYSLYGRTGSGHTPSRSVEAYWVDCDIPWITTGDVAPLRSGFAEDITETKEQISRLGMANSAATLHPAGTVVLSRTASVGFAGVMPRPMATSQDFFTWSPGDRLDSYFLLWSLRAMKFAGTFDRLMYGSTHKTIYVPDLVPLRGPVPDLATQHEAVRAIRRARDVTRQALDRLSQQRDLLQERRQALITAAVTGEIEV